MPEIKVLTICFKLSNFEIFNFVQKNAVMRENIRVLLVEDDENLGSLLCDYLKAKGFLTELFTDGEKGYKAFMIFAYLT